MHFMIATNVYAAVLYNGEYDIYSFDPDMNNVTYSKYNSASPITNLNAIWHDDYTFSFFILFNKDNNNPFTIFTDANQTILNYNGGGTYSP